MSQPQAQNLEKGRPVLRVERVQDSAGLEALRGPWAELTAEVPDASLFVTWEWVNAWCHHLEPNWDLWVLVAWDDAGCLAGVAPWMLTRHHYGPVRVDRLSFLGTNYAYRIHQDVVARPADKPAVLAAFMDYLIAHRQAWDVLDLEGLAESSMVKPFLAAEKAGRYGEKEPELCPYVTLPGRWEDYELQKLSANRRQQLRARLRRLERDHPGQVELGRVRTSAELTEAMDALVLLHRERWHGRGQTSSFDVPTFLAFHREVAAVALEHDWLRLYWVKVAGEIIAAEYCFYYRGVLFDYQKAFDPDWDAYSPGQIVLGYAIRETIAEGGHELDMARGTYDYKFSWTDQERVDHHVALSSSLPGHLWLFGGNFLVGARNRARTVLPDGLRERINHMLSPKRSEATAMASDK
jgi:CelD/BcsL family acetyltransferase involved in cellulose biosynthesis